MNVIAPAKKAAFLVRSDVEGYNNSEFGLDFAVSFVTFMDAEADAMKPLSKSGYWI